MGSSSRATRTKSSSWNKIQNQKAQRHEHWVRRARTIGWVNGRGRKWRKQSMANIRKVTYLRRHTFTIFNDQLLFWILDQILTNFPRIKSNVRSKLYKNFELKILKFCLIKLKHVRKISLALYCLGNFNLVWLRLIYFELGQLLLQNQNLGSVL